jgi:NAD-dependent deacetylase
VIKEIFYDYFDRAQPNAAHRALADLERLGKIKCVITQNIDNLHQEAGSEKIYEFHGNSKRLICTACGELLHASEAIFANFPPKCKVCGQLLKPDFVFFGETIPQEAWQNSFAAAEHCDVLLMSARPAK